MNKQEFENGEEVEAFGMGEWLPATYIGFDESNNQHIVSFMAFEYNNVLPTNIRPKQLICDKAREVIKKYAYMEKCFKFVSKSKKEFKEVLSIMKCDRGESIGRFCYYDKSKIDWMHESNYSKCDFDELNLSTGEIVPVEGVTEKELDKVESVLAENKKLQNELKEKDKYIEDLEDVHSDTMINLGTQLKAKDAQLQKLIANQGRLNSIIINTTHTDVDYEALYKKSATQIIEQQDKLKEKDAEISALIDRNRKYLNKFKNQDKQIKSANKRKLEACEKLKRKEKQRSDISNKLNSIITEKDAEIERKGRMVAELKDRNDALRLEDRDKSKEIEMLIANQGKSNSIITKNIDEIERYKKVIKSQSELLNEISKISTPF